MLNKVYLWIAGVLALVAGVVGIYLKGRSSGKEAEVAQQKESDLEAKQKEVDTLSTVNSVASDIARTSDSDVQQRLRDKYSRD